MEYESSQTGAWSGQFHAVVTLGPNEDLIQATAVLPARGGVCLLADQNDRPIQLLALGEMRRQVRARLVGEPQEGGGRKVDLRGMVRRIHYSPCYSPFETQLHYFRSVQAVFPESWQEHLPKMEAWFIEIDLRAELPVFRRIRRYWPGPVQYWGPLPTMGAATRAIALLQSAFGLCRHPERLADAPRASGCPYAQMNRCAAVCNGSVSFERYRHQIDRAVDLLNRGQRAILEELGAEVQRYSDALEFEKAAELHRQINELKELEKPSYRWCMPMTDFCLLAFHPGPPVKIKGMRSAQPSLTPFVITAGEVVPLQPVTNHGLEAESVSILEHCQRRCQRQGAGAYGEIEARQLAWIGQMLYRPKARPELFLPVSKLGGSGDVLAAHIAGHFNLLWPPDSSGQPESGGPGSQGQVAEVEGEDPLAGGSDRFDAGDGK